MSQLLMRDLLDYAQLKASSFRISNGYFSLGQVVKRTFDTNKKAAKDKKIKLIGPYFPEPSHQIFFERLRGDEQRYFQVLVNFVNNAVKFTPKYGSISVIVELLRAQKVKLQLASISEESGTQNGSDFDESSSQNAVSDEESNNSEEFKEENKDQFNIKEVVDEKSLVKVLIDFTVTIRDTGVGISDENKAKLFKDFSKLDDAQQQNKSGVGLGLTIARDLV